jgi:cell division protein FtsB
MEWPPESFWLTAAIAIPSAAVMVSGYRASIMAELRAEIEELKAEVKRLRRRNDWLLDQSRLRFGVKPPNWSEEDNDQ